MAAGQSAHPILSQIDLTIHKGQWVTLLGRNGSGKSTLAKAIAGFRMPGITGQIRRQPRSELHGKPIPIVLQQPEASMVGSTPWEDVVLLLEQNELKADSIIGRAESALREVGLGDRLHQPIETLSGGQKQLVAIAGCLAMQSPLLVLDEVTSMLDPEAAQAVLERVRSLHAAGATVLWITQRLEELPPGGRIAALADGRLIFDGSAEEWFDRAAGGTLESICEKLGFEAPYAAQVAWELEREGVRLRPFPFTAELLAEAVNNYER